MLLQRLATGATGRMLLQRLATGATGVKQARYRRGPTRGSEALVRACAVYSLSMSRDNAYMNSAEGFAF